MTYSGEIVITLDSEFCCVKDAIDVANIDICPNLLQRPWNNGFHFQVEVCNEIV